MRSTFCFSVVVGVAGELLEVDLDGKELSLLTDRLVTMSLFIYSFSIEAHPNNPTASRSSWEGEAS